MARPATHKLTTPQRRIVNALTNGRDLRTWQVNHTTLLALVRRGLVDYHATTQRLYLVGPQTGGNSI